MHSSPGKESLHSTPESGKAGITVKFLRPKGEGLTFKYVSWSFFPGCTCEEDLPPPCFVDSAFAPDPTSVPRLLEGGAGTDVHARFAPGGSPLTLAGLRAGPSAFTRGPGGFPQAGPRGLGPRPSQPGAGPASHVTAAPSGERPAPREEARAATGSARCWRCTAAGALSTRGPSPAGPGLAGCGSGLKMDEDGGGGGGGEGGGGECRRCGRRGWRPGAGGRGRAGPERGLPVPGRGSVVQVRLKRPGLGSASAGCRPPRPAARAGPGARGGGPGAPRRGRRGARARVWDEAGAARRPGPPGGSGRGSGVALRRRGTLGATFSALTPSGAQPSVTTLPASSLRWWEAGSPRETGMAKF